MKTIRTQQFGKITARLVQTAAGYSGVLVGEGVPPSRVDGEDAEIVWAALVENLNRASPQFFGFEGARARFLKLFPDGFASPAYRSHERDYKDAARVFLASTVSIEQAERATATECDAIARAYSKTNLLASFEQARVREVLKSEHGPGYVRGAAALARGDTAEGLKAMEDAMRPYGQPSWPGATYLPYLWSPGEHMFLKPQVTVDFAERVGHSFARDYTSALTADCYRSLLDLTARTRSEISALAPRDNIDLQSFIWAVGAYDGDAAVE